MLNNLRISALKTSISSYWISNTSCGFPMLEYLKWKLIVSYNIKPFTWDPEVPQYLIFIKRLKPHYKAPGDLQVKIEMAQLLTLCGLGESWDSQMTDYKKHISKLEKQQKKIHLEHYLFHNLPQYLHGQAFLIQCQKESKACLNVVKSCNCFNPVI